MQATPSFRENLNCPTTTSSHQEISQQQKKQGPPPSARKVFEQLQTQETTPTPLSCQVKDNCLPGQEQTLQNIHTVSQRSLSHLAPELKLKILEYIPPRELNNIVPVDSQWNHLASVAAQDRLNHQEKVSQIFKDQGLLKYLENHGPRVRCLNLQDFPLNDALLEQILKKCPNLEYLKLDSQQVTHCNASLCPKLKEFDAAQAVALRDVNLGGCSALKILNLTNTKIQALNLSDHQHLKTILLSFSDIKQIDLQRCPQLQHVDVQWTSLPHLDLSNLGQLKHVVCHNMSHLSTLNLQGCHHLRILEAGRLKLLTSLDLSGLSKLEALECYDSENLRDLNLSQCHQLKQLGVAATALPTLDLTPHPQLEYLDCSETPISTLTAENLPHLNIFLAKSSNLHSLNLSNLPKLEIADCEGSHRLANFFLNNSQAVQVLNLADTSLSHVVLGNMPELLSVNCDDMQSLRKLSLYNCPKLQEVMASYSQELQTLDLSNRLPMLESICCREARNLAALSIGNCQATLKTVDIRCTAVSSLNVSYYTSLEKIDCDSASKLSELHVSGCRSLKSLNADATALLYLDASGLRELKKLSLCGNDQLFKLNVRNCVKLNEIKHANSNITDINTQGCPYFDSPYLRESERLH